eukprot:CAMPEP_0117073382 /NCGR_PEP_ID=MMETSP0472-20121206/51680_1 /TAXON_ID=693140 ORGANISM="Tiarina fusus, Strain LIS" /NCGR_SAMPLE_ID=MMETSP0472 /ASSEMBLY_ACC=CAM_ASM_000603 /LENGTH=203 /DNA_ID=CAMNT_0004797931 /DNA_START=1 /DNA_END=612 /DNA_ORIENTATION=+
MTAQTTTTTTNEEASTNQTGGHVTTTCPEEVVAAMEPSNEPRDEEMQEAGHEISADGQLPAAALSSPREVTGTLEQLIESRDEEMQEFFNTTKLADKDTTIEEVNPTDSGLSGHPKSSLYVQLPTTLPSQQQQEEFRRTGVDPLLIEPRDEEITQEVYNTTRTDTLEEEVNPSPSGLLSAGHQLPSLPNPGTVFQELIVIDDD